jgi:hypothetical protein
MQSCPRHRSVRRGRLRRPRISAPCDEVAIRHLRRARIAQDPRHVPGILDWWRRRDSCSTVFTAGWTMPSPRPLPGAGRVIRQTPPDPGCCPGSKPRQLHESLQGRHGVGLLPTPRRHRLPPLPAPSGFADVSPVLSSPLRVNATLVIEPASASPTPQDLRACPRLLISPSATRRAGKTLSQLRNVLAEAARSTPIPRSCERVPRVRTHRHVPVGG